MKCVCTVLFTQRSPPLVTQRKVVRSVMRRPEKDYAKKTLTSIPSLSITALSIPRIACFKALMGGNLVKPMLIAWERFISKTTISFFLSLSSPSHFCKRTRKWWTVKWNACNHQFHFPNAISGFKLKYKAVYWLKFFKQPFPLEMTISGSRFSNSSPICLQLVTICHSFKRTVLDKGFHS